MTADDGTADDNEPDHLYRNMAHMRHKPISTRTVAYD